MNLIFFKNENTSLSATFQFSNFKEAFSFMTEVASAAESLQHHPEWKNIYNKVEICLRTHDANNTLTEKDYELAAVIEAIIANYKFTL